jgi:hypothetical protein
MKCLLFVALVFCLFLFGFGLASGAILLSELFR